MFRNIKFLYQRLTRGFDDSETWDLDNTFRKWIVPRLKRLKEIQNGYPPQLTEEKWDEIIDKIIEGFDVELNPLDKYINREDYLEAERKHNEAAELFSLYLRNLWW